ncbi:MAG: M12 family metallopeptidase [Spirosomataceae bacterium]
MGRQFSAGNLNHEIMHMLGFYHEHQRADWDSFVKINFGNVKRAFYFDMIQEPNLTEYDNGSIMQYPRIIANTNLVNDPKKDTIIPLKSLDVETILGQRGRLSSQDIQGINILYPEVSGVRPLALEATLIEIELASI